MILYLYDYIFIISTIIYQCFKEQLFIQTYCMWLLLFIYVFIYLFMTIKLVLSYILPINA